MLGPGRVYIPSWIVFEHWESPGCEEAYFGLCINSETWFDPEFVGFFTEAEVSLIFFENLTVADCQCG
jgi:hypothetical protein